MVKFIFKQKSTMQQSDEHSNQPYETNFSLPNLPFPLLFLPLTGVITHYGFLFPIL